MEKELEVKVLGMDLEKLEERVISLGGSLIGEEEQINILIDSKENPIKSYLDAYLRIRESKDLIGGKNHTYLTLKKNLNREGLRENEELNVKIDNKELMLKILKELGFESIDVGFKHRKSYELMGARLDFDTWDEKVYPFPYMEIEVKDLESLRQLTGILNIPEENVSTKSIMDLRKEIRLV